MTDTDSVGQREMRALSRLQACADELEGESEQKARFVPGAPDHEACATGRGASRASL